MLTSAEGRGKSYQSKSGLLLAWRTSVDTAATAILHTADTRDTTSSLHKSSPTSVVMICKTAPTFSPSLVVTETLARPDAERRLQISAKEPSKSHSGCKQLKEAVYYYGSNNPTKMNALFSSFKYGSREYKQLSRL